MLLNKQTVVYSTYILHFCLPYKEKDSKSYPSGPHMNKNCNTHYGVVIK